MEALERRALLAADITVLGPTGVNIPDGGSIDLSPLIGPVQQMPASLAIAMAVRNDGDTDLNLGTMTETGDFVIDTQPPATIAAGSAALFVVDVSLVTAGHKSSTFSVPTNDPDENPFDFTLDLDVLPAPAPEITVALGANNIVDGVTNVDYGSVLQGQAAPVRTFTVSNDGTSALTLGAINVPTGYTVTEGLVSSLAVGASDTFTVQLDTAVAGTKAGFITFGNNDSDESPFDIPVTGTVIATVPEITVLGPGGTNIADGGTIDLTPLLPPVNQMPGSSLSIPLTIRNDGTASLTLGSVSTVGDFGVQGQPAATVAAGASTTLTLSLDLSIEGPRTGSISFATNDADENPFNFDAELFVVPGANEVAVTNNGVDLVSGVTQVNFGSVTQGQPGPTQTFTVSNTGTGRDLLLGSVSVPTGYTLTEGLAPVLAPGASDTFTVRLDSATAGVKNGSITFPTDDTDESLFTIPVTGAVVTPEITVLDGATNIVDGVTTVNYGNVTQGQAGPVRTFTVRNDGTAALTLGAISLPAGYTLTDGLVSSLAVGASDTLSVRLDSAVLGTKTGFITFANNDLDENPFDIPVTGTVLAATGAPEVVVRVGGRDVVDGRTQVSFGAIQQGRVGPTRTFTVTNTGTAPLTLGTPTMPAGYSLVEGLVSSLAAGASDTFTVRLDSAAVGAKTGVIRFANNDSNENPFDILVSGKVVPPNSTTLLASMATLFSQSLIGGG